MTRIGGSPRGRKKEEKDNLVESPLQNNLITSYIIRLSRQNEKNNLTLLIIQTTLDLTKTMFLLKLQQRVLSREY